jgi:hypothetical protein
MRNSSTIAAAAAALGVLACPALAQTACEPLTLVSDGSARAVTFVDVDGDGAASAGDMRIGRKALADENGNAVGTYHWNTVVHETADSGGTGFGILVFELDGGALYGQRLTTQQRDADDTSLPRFDQPEAGIIQGGTGTYAFARGTFEVTRDENTVTYHIDVRCD